jgi:AraC-like DNA-binding protein
VVTTDRPRTQTGRKAPGSPNHIATLFPLHRAIGALERHQPLRLIQRTGALGPITVLDLKFGADTWIRCADERPYYQVNIVATGRIQLRHRGREIVCAPGLANVCLPEGELTVHRWSAGSRVIAVRMNRDVLEDALSEALGRELTTQIDFALSVATARGPARTWVQMFGMLAGEIFRPDTAVNQPLVQAPLVHSLIHAMLLATDHPYRSLLSAQAKFVAPASIRPAVDIIEAEPYLPLTVNSLARRCGIGSRSLQQNFVRHLGVSPMAYLQQVRLRRAHQDLLAADPSVETVAEIARRWGYTNAGRFAAAHSARYGEPPLSTLRRSAITHRRPKPSAHNTQAAQPSPWRSVRQQPAKLEKSR